MRSSPRRAVLVAALLTAALTNLTAQEPVDTSCDNAITHGVAAFKDARYEAAVQHFKAATAFDPTSAKARLYLGNAYAYLVVPNLDTPANLAMAKNAIDTLSQVPGSAEEHLAALKQIASVHFNVKRLDEAKETELEVLRYDPADAEAHYTIGVIDWMKAYQNAVRVLANVELKDDGIGNVKLNTSACLDLSSQNSALIQDGIDHLTRAIELNPDYDDAMQYLNLTYRRHADLACGDDAKRSEDLTLAAQWSQKALAARKRNEETRASRIQK